jgi:hypothetical protein
MLFAIIIGKVTMLLGASAASESVYYPPLWHWIQSQPAFATGLISGESHYLHKSLTARTMADDCFLVRAHAQSCNDTWGPDPLLRSGTLFLAGSAGPEHYYVLYDPVHRIARISRGCCSYTEQLLVGDVGPPPQHVVERDLSALRTRLGVKLGASTSAVERIFGPAKKSNKSRTPGWTGLFYDFTRAHSPTCVQDTTFVFHNGRLAAISLWNGC